MSEQQVIDIARRAVFLIIECSAPLLIISLVVGLVISIFQTITSIQEQTLTFVPKIVAVFFGVMLLGSWIINNITSYMNELEVLAEVNQDSLVIMDELGSGTDPAEGMGIAISILEELRKSGK